MCRLEGNEEEFGTFHICEKCLVRNYFLTLFQVCTPAFCKSTSNIYFIQSVNLCPTLMLFSCPSEAVRKKDVSSTWSFSGYASVHTGIKETKSKQLGETMLLVCLPCPGWLPGILGSLLVGHWWAIWKQYSPGCLQF